MRTLAIECATEACSIALFDGETLLANDHRVLGRGHAEHLVPMIAALPEKGKAERILVSRGPGSFTGVRIGIATARALGIAWKAEVLGYPALGLVAAMVPGLPEPFPRPFEVGGPPPFLVCMHGGHGEWFVQPFNQAIEPTAAVKSMPPDEAISQFNIEYVVGSRAEEFVSLKGSGKAEQVLPDARHVCWIGSGHLTQSVSPIYGRAPDAKLPA